MVRQDGFPGVLVRAAEGLVRRRLDADRKNLAAWDASAGVRQDALADECRALRRLDADAEKSVDQELACQAPDALPSDELADPVAVQWLAAALQLVLAVPDKPGVVLSAAQSCAVQESADELAEQVLVVELELVRWATELVPTVQSSLAELACAPSEVVPVWLTLRMAVLRSVRLEPPVALA